MKTAFCANAFGNTQADTEAALPLISELGYDGVYLASIKAYAEDSEPGSDTRLGQKTFTDSF